MYRMMCLHLALCTLLLGSAEPSCIPNPDELRMLLDVASDGDTLTICDGDHKDRNIEVETSGVRLHPETLGGATFHDGSWFDLKGNRNTLAGIKMHGGGSTTPIRVRIWQCHGFF